MKARTIKKIIREKVDEWLASIDDADLREILKKKVVVTGGCIASMLLREKVNDFDVYLRDRDACLRDRDACLRVARYYVGRFKPKNAAGIPCQIYVYEDDPDRVSIVVKSAGVASEEGTDDPYEYFEGRPDGDLAAERYVTAVMNDPGEIEDANEEIQDAVTEAIDEGAPYRPVFLSTNAITLSKRLQVVIRFYGEPNEIHANYDFAHCTSYWRSWDDELVLRPEAMEALLTRDLRYVGSKYPLCSLIRVRKFIQRGWQINAGQILKMVMQLHDLDLSDPKVLRDQLTGVDAAYFCEIMAKLRDKDPEKVNSAYLCEIIDRMY